jgi:LmbE family N-acetylglucosaminyl deacetylase
MALAALLVFSVIHLWDSNEPAHARNLSRPDLTLAPTDRVLVLAPHPDDEVLGCGGVLQHAVALGLPVRIVFLTYGDFYEWSFIRHEKRPVLTPRGVEGMGEVRQSEALAADATLGVPAADLVFLGYPDFGALKMWYEAWGSAPPIRGGLTRATAVPYPDAFRPGAPYKGDEVLNDLTAILRAFRPTKVFVSHPADHHPDHKALYLFARIALFDVAPEIAPQVYPYLIHYTKWPVPSGRRPEETLEPPAFLGDKVAWQILGLSMAQVSAKGDALKKHETQYETTPKFLDSFVRCNELFGDFPAVRLDRQTVLPAESPAGSADGMITVGQEEAHLVGVVAWAVRIEDESLVLSLRLTRSLAREVGCSVDLFGYRRDEPFSGMPKLHISIGELTHKILDAGREVAFRDVQVRRAGRDIRIQVPLPVLRQPQGILATAQMHVGFVPLEWTSWRILEIGGALTGGSEPLARPEARGAHP